MRRTEFVLSAVMVTFFCATAAAQQRVIGIYGTVARPIGEFQQFVELGGGFGAYGLFNLDRSGHVGLRLDGTFVIYGHERYTAPLSLTVPRVVVDVNTNNFIATLAAGPQLTLGRGALRPYVFGTVGLAYFATVSSVGGTARYGDFGSSTNFDDVALALSAGGGLLIRLSRGRHPVSLDLVAQTTHHGEVEYLTRGDIVDNPDGSITIFPIRSQTNLVTFRVGVLIGL